MKIMKQNKILQNKLIYIKKETETKKNRKTKLSKMNNFREKKKHIYIYMYERYKEPKLRYK